MNKKITKLGIHIPSNVLMLLTVLINFFVYWLYVSTDLFGSFGFYFVFFFLITCTIQLSCLVLFVLSTIFAFKNKNRNGTINLIPFFVNIGLIVTLIFGCTLDYSKRDKTTLGLSSSMAETLRYDVVLDSIKEAESPSLHINDGDDKDYGYQGKCNELIKQLEELEVNAVNKREYYASPRAGAFISYYVGGLPYYGITIFENGMITTSYNEGGYLTNTYYRYYEYKISEFQTLFNTAFEYWSNN